MPIRSRIHRNDSMPEDAIGLGRAARLLGCSLSTVWRWIASGQLPAWYTQGARRRSWRVSRADVLERVHRYQPRTGPMPESVGEARAREAFTSTVLRREGVE